MISLLPIFGRDSTRRTPFSLLYRAILEATNSITSHQFCRSSSVHMLNGLLTPLGIGNTDHSHFIDLFMTTNSLFHFRRIYFFAICFNKFLLRIFPVVVKKAFSVYWTRVMPTIMKSIRRTLLCFNNLETHKVHCSVYGASNTSLKEMHFSCLITEVISKFWSCKRNDLFRTLCHSLSFEHCNAMFCNQIMDICSRCCYNGPWR